MWGFPSFGAAGREQLAWNVALLVAEEIVQSLANRDP